MFKLQINWLREGKWEDTVYREPDTYENVLKLMNRLSGYYPEHDYRILSMMEVK